MAKKTKDSNLSLEERLEQALIPNWDEPYKLPENWCWTRISHLCSLSNGRAFKPTEWGTTGYPIVRIQNLNNPEVEYNYYSGNIEEKYKLVGGELLFAWSGTPGTSFGAHIWSGKEAVLNQHIFRVDFNETYINKIFLKHAINQQLEMLISAAHGGAGLQHVTKGVFEATPIPFPPLLEQERIVARIESLFAKLDEAKEKAQEVVDGFETRKAAILHKAFSGELTAKWREENGVSISNWEHHNFSDLCKIVRGGSPRPAGSPEFYGGDIPFMKVADITRITTPYIESTEYFIKPAGLKKTRMVKANTLLLTNSGATLGVPAICTFETTFNDGIAAFLDLPSDSLLFYYYFWTLKTPELRAINKGAAQPNLNTEIIGAVELDVPSAEEQKVITKILEQLISKEQQAKEIAESVIEQIDTMKKAILARAFRGELGTNDPSEESAVELLKRVLSGGEN